MESLRLIKKELKCWENRFELLHGHRPAKDDVTNAPEEIKEAYKRYQQLKQADNVQVQDSKDEKSSVFGRTLNKKKTAQIKSPPFKAVTWPGLALPTKHCKGKKPKNSALHEVQDPNIHGIPDTACEKVKTTDLFETDKLALSITSNSVIDRPTSATPFLSPLAVHAQKSKMLSGRLKRRKSVPLTWLDRVKCDSLDSLPVPSLDGDQSKFSDTVEGENDESAMRKKTESCSSNGIYVSPEGSKGCSRFVGTSTSESQENCTMEDLDTCMSPERNNSLKVNIQSSSQGDSSPKGSRLPRILEVDDDRDVSQYSSRNTDTTILQKANCDVQNFPCNVAAGEAINDELQGVCADNVSHKKRKFDASTASTRVKKLPKLSNNKVIETKTERSRVSSSGLVSDNFQRLNMKHRHYRRRGAGVSGSMYKRRKWREMTKSRGEHDQQSSTFGRAGASSSKNLGVCFKCGEEGHWSKNCSRKNSGKNAAMSRFQNKSGSNTDDENCEEFPSIDEAAMMAVGIPLNTQTKGPTEGSQRHSVILPHELPRAAYVPPTPPSPIEPLYQAVNGQAVATSKDVILALEKLGFSSFRTGQETTVMRILCGLSTLVVLSTGAGKSLCYQLPAFLYAESRSPCLTLVICPLVSLMEDQVSSLPPCLKGACLHTNMSKVQRQKVIEDLCSGKVSVLLISPEALVAGGGKGCLPAAANLPPVAFACIDEAHCLSEWSHNFRPSYLRVCKVLRERFGVQCFLGLTATATLSTATSAAEHLGIIPDDSSIVRGVAVPSNLNLSVSCDGNRDKALVELLRSDPFSQCDSVIIYCTRRDETERVASMLRTCLQNVPKPRKMVESSGKNKKGNRTKRKKVEDATLMWDVESYHAGMTAAQRRRVQKRFMSGDLSVVVATVAFGMGLDKSDVRTIIHYNMPKTFEGYVQEIGRAGRDGLPAYCHLFLAPEGKDMCELRRHIYANTVDRVTVKKLVNRVFPCCKCTDLQQLKEERKECDTAAAALIDDECEMMMDELECGSARSMDEHKTSDNGSESNNGTDELSCCGNESEIVMIVPNTEATAALEKELVEQSDDNRDMLINSSESDEILTGDGSSSVQVKGGLCCGGHDVALVTDDLVDELDMRQENILTLLCYLELPPKCWIQVLQPIKSACTIKFYGGFAQLKSTARKVPIVAAAAAIGARKSGKMQRCNTLTFPVVEVADKMGWDLDPVCRELRALQWNTSLSVDTSDASHGQSGILVEFSDLSFHVRAPGDLSDEQRDKISDFLEDRILAEERSQLEKLNAVYSALQKVSCAQFWRCTEKTESDVELKEIIQIYFQNSTDQTKVEMEKLSSARNSAAANFRVSDDVHVNWEGIGRDIRAFVGVHHDHSFTGRNVARIFHGIESPCYPAVVWGRDRRFWRKHLDVDFNTLRKFSTKELLKLR